MPERFFGCWCIHELKLQSEGGLQFEPWELKRGWLEPLGRPLDFFGGAPAHNFGCLGAFLDVGAYISSSCRAKGVCSLSRGSLGEASWNLWAGRWTFLGVPRPIILDAWALFWILVHTRAQAAE